LRSLRKNPVFTIAASLALALGIGATTALLSVVNAVLLRPLPYADADRLVVLSHGGSGTVAAANFVDWRRGAHAFTDAAAAEYWTPNLATGSGGAAQTGPEAIYALRLTAGMFSMLGVRPQLGRVFTTQEDVPGS